MKEIIGGTSGQGNLLCENYRCNLNKLPMIRHGRKALIAAAKKHENNTGHDTVIILDDKTPLSNGQLYTIELLTGVKL